MIAARLRPNDLGQTWPFICKYIYRSFVDDKYAIVAATVWLQRVDLRDDAERCIGDLIASIPGQLAVGLTLTNPEYPMCTYRSGLDARSMCAFDLVVAAQAAESSLYLIKRDLYARVKCAVYLWHLQTVPQEPHDEAGGEEEGPDSDPDLNERRYPVSTGLWAGIKHIEVSSVGDTPITIMAECTDDADMSWTLSIDKNNVVNDGRHATCVHDAVFQLLIDLIPTVIKFATSAEYCMPAVVVDFIAGVRALIRFVNAQFASTHAAAALAPQ